MKRSNLIPITRIYDIYPKYTYSDDVKKFMDEIVDIDRADVYTKDEVISMLTEIQLEIKEIKPLEPTDDEDWQYGCFHGLELMQDMCLKIIQQKINKLKESKYDR